MPFINSFLRCAMRKISAKLDKIFERILQGGAIYSFLTILTECQPHLILKAKANIRHDESSVGEI